MFTTAQELIEFVQKQEVQFVDIRFCDLPGVVQHFNLPAASYGEDEITEGLLFDGSSIRGFQGIHESDMKLLADVSSAYVDPFRAAKTLVITHSIVDPFTDEPYSRDPRQVAEKAEAYLGARASRTRSTSVRRRSSTSSTRSAIRTPPATASTRSIRSRPRGTRARTSRAGTSGTRRR